MPQDEMEVGAGDLGPDIGIGLKDIRCDRQFPCSHCRKRGIAS
jgi:hypothetical protein